MYQFVLSEPWEPAFAQIDLKDATITIQDGASASIAVKVGQGNLTFTERQNIEYTLDRGVIDEVREGDEVPMEVSFAFTWLYVDPASGGSIGGTVTIEDAFKQTGAASGWTSSDADICRPYAVDIVIALAPDCDAVSDSTITLPDFRWEQLEHNLREGTISVSGKCNATKATRA